MIIKTDAVVLHARRFRESSKIVTLYTREYGKVSVVARGAVQMKSKFGATLQPMACISTVIYIKPNRDLQNLSGAEPLAHLTKLMGSLERMSAGLSIVELVHAAIHGEDRNDPLFESLLTAIQALNSITVDERNILIWFMIQLSTHLGYAVVTGQCGVCSEPFSVSGPTVPYSVTIGAPLCSEHRESGGYRLIQHETFYLLKALCTMDAESAATVEVGAKSQDELTTMLGSFIRYHIDGLGKLNVNGVSMQMQQSKRPL